MQDQYTRGLVVAPLRGALWVVSVLREGPSRLRNSVSKHTENILVYLRKGKLFWVTRAWAKLKCWELKLAEDVGLRSLNSSCREQDGAAESWPRRSMFLF